MEKNRNERKILIYNLMKDKHYVPMKVKELAILLQVKREDRDELQSILDELIAEQKIMLSKRGKYSLFVPKEIKGTFSSTKQGFGFVTVEGEEDDYFISEKDTKNAFDGDIVLILCTKEKKDGRRKEAKVVAILEHSITRLVGTYDKSKNRYGFVIPDNQKLVRDIFVPFEHSMDAVSGHKVVCEIVDYGNEYKSPEGRIVEILGHSNEPGVDILSVVKDFNLPTEFPEKVMNRLSNINDYVTEADMNMRRDLRGLLMVTIDGEDTKDIDDAVSVYMEDDLYHLGVHIADVANYVQENSALDKEALKRGTSVYLADRVIPMLPPKLSNGICSLNEKEVRLALSCLMTINKNGEVIDHEIVESVIQTNARMTYTDVNLIIEDKDKETCDKYEELVPMFMEMKELADILRERRKKRGSIDFDLPESKMILDKNGKVLEIKPYERNSATKLIEDFMLATNETVSEHFYFLDVPFLYRVHEKPDVEKIRKLATFISNFGYGFKIKDDEVHPKELQKLLAKIENTKEETLISRLTLRSMQRAKYLPQCLGHFGLACQYYSHFTSPIRRYPDLQIHRIIKDSIHGRLNADRIKHYESIMEQVAKQCSDKERVADDAEREVEKMKKCQYMKEHIGETYIGVISGVTNWGIYVELENSCEGLIHISKINDDFYVYNESSYEIKGQSTGKTYCLGEKVEIVVNGVDELERTIDFVLADDYISRDGKR